MKRAVGVLALGALVACATLGAPGSDDAIQPSAGVGPFRALTSDELKGLAPYVLDDRRAQFREPAVYRDDAATVIFAVARVGADDVIVRTHATDERTFFGSGNDSGHAPQIVLAPDQPWEGALGGPSLVPNDGLILLYYAGAGGIGLARSTDGHTFTKVPGPVFQKDAAAATWETTAPHAPSVFLAQSGRFRMLYASGDAIGEAESLDGVTWHRLGAAPVLQPAPPAAPGSLLPFEKPPFDTAVVGDPCVATEVTAAGRFLVRVLYTGVDSTGASAIGFAARYGDDGALSRNGAPVYSAGRHEAAPALLDLGLTSFLYVQEDRKDGDDLYTAVAAAIAPGDTPTLPPASDYPSGP